jgi:hypothetical protein
MAETSPAKPLPSRSVRGDTLYVTFGLKDDYTCVKFVEPDWTYSSFIELRLLYKYITKDKNDLRSLMRYLEYFDGYGDNKFSGSNFTEFSVHFDDAWMILEYELPLLATEDIDNDTPFQSRRMGIHQDLYAILKTLSKPVDPANIPSEIRNYTRRSCIREILKCQENHKKLKEEFWRLPRSMLESDEERSQRIAKYVKLSKYQYSWMAAHAVMEDCYLPNSQACFLHKSCLQEIAEFDETLKCLIDTCGDSKLHDRNTLCCGLCATGDPWEKGYLADESFDGNYQSDMLHLNSPAIVEENLKSCVVFLLGFFDSENECCVNLTGYEKHKHRFERMVARYYRTLLLFVSTPMSLDIYKSDLGMSRFIRPIVQYFKNDGFTFEQPNLQQTFESLP